ncbi:hypothetical protein BH10PSE3_BH10PSE3_12990 [soil metagenome]
MDTRISALTPDLRSALESGLDLAARLVAPRPLSDAHIEALYDALLDESVENVEAIIALGLSFGETFVSRGGYEWVRVQDEYGEENCVAMMGKSLFCAPISMIQKRLADKERPDIRLLREGTIGRLAELAENAGERRAYPSTNTGPQAT